MNETPAKQIEEVRIANSLFYQAMEDGDSELMSAVWLHADWVKCIHPGWDLITGWEKVLESWEQIFEGKTGMRIAPADVEITVEGNFALVSCYEDLAIFLPQRAAPVSARTTATNLFQLAGGEWLMIHHHASQVPNSPMVSEDNFAGSGEISFE